MRYQGRWIWRVWVVWVFARIFGVQPIVGLGWCGMPLRFMKPTVRETWLWHTLALSTCSTSTGCSHVLLNQTDSKASLCLHTSFMRQVLKIKELSVAGSQQLAVDLEYLRKAWSWNISVDSHPFTDSYSSDIVYSKIQRYIFCTAWHIAEGRLTVPHAHVGSSGNLEDRVQSWSLKITGTSLTSWANMFVQGRKSNSQQGSNEWHLPKLSSTVCFAPNWREFSKSHTLFSWEADTSKDTSNRYWLVYCVILKTRYQSVRPFLWKTLT